MRIINIPRCFLLSATIGCSLIACQAHSDSSIQSTASVTASSASHTYDVVKPILNFKRGVNLGNALDAPNEGDWGVTLVPAHFTLAKSGGFDHVRLPVRFSAHALQKAPYSIDEKFFRRVDWAIDQARSAGLGIIVEIHHYNELMDAPDAHADRFIGLWKQIAERYAKQPPNVLFELLNEPSGKLGVQKLNALYARTIPLIRASNPTRIIMADSYYWANVGQLHALKLPDDSNIVAQFHMYEPMLFTHQGATWMPPEFETIGVVFPGPPSIPIKARPAAEKDSESKQWFVDYNRLPADRNPNGVNTVRALFDSASAYAKASGHRVYLGEFGVVDNADSVSRKVWLTTVREAAESRGIAWCYWDDGNAFRLLNVKGGTFVEPVHKALIP